MSQTGNGRPHEQPSLSSTAVSPTPEPDDPRVIAALEEYLSAMKAGQPLVRGDFLARHAEIAGALGECLEGLEWIRGAPAGPPLATATDLGATAVVQPGTFLGDYQIMREVGRGGMGVVYEAVQLSLGRRVALKVLPLATALDAKQLQRFKNEAQAAAYLHHTNIVPVFGIGSERGVHYYAMQFIDGQTLAAFIEELRQNDNCRSTNAEGTLNDEIRMTNDVPDVSASETQQLRHSTFGIHSAFGIQHSAFFRTVATLGVQAAQALEHAHQLGVVHRDIKPGNLLVETTPVNTPPGKGVGNQDLRLWVTDFGLAHMQSQAGLTMTGDLVGTLRYMSPEQALGKRALVDQHTDIYSLGVTLYELLTLEPAFAGHNREELLRQIAFEEPRPPRRLNQAVPGELETIVLKALAKDPAERYATAQELADDLERFLRDEPIQARRPTVLQRARKWARRHRAVVRTVLLGLAAVVLVLAGSIGWVLRDQAARREEGEQRAQDALQQANRLLQNEKWSEGLGFVGHAEAILGSFGGSEDLLDQAAGLRQALETAQRLEEAPLQMTAVKDDVFDLRAAATAYGEAFAKYDLDVDGCDPAEAVHSIMASPIRRQLVAALDHWALLRKDLKLPGWQRRLALARAADPDRWRNRLRDAVEGKDRKALPEALHAAAPNDWPPATLVLLGRLGQTRSLAKSAAAVLYRGQQRHPDNFWINQQLGLIYSTARPPRLAEAHHYFAIAVALRPQSPGAHLNLGGTLDDLDRTEEAIACYRKAIALDPGYSHAQRALGHSLCKQGNVADGMAHLHKAVALAPRSAPAHNELGTALFSQKKFDEAAAWYRKGLAIDPNLAILHTNLGGVLRVQQKMDEAMVCLRKAVALDPWYARGHYRLGCALDSQRKFDEAIACYRKAIALDPTDYLPYLDLGAILSNEKRDYAAAIECFRKVIDLKPATVQAYYNLGVALKNQKKTDEAIASYRRAIDLDPTNARAYSNLGALLFDTKHDHDGAIACLRKSVEFDPGIVEAHRNLGLFLRRKGQWDEAIAVYSRALELHPRDPPLWYARAHCYVKIRAYARAIADLAKVAELLPQNALLHIELAWLMINCPDASVRDAGRGLTFARKAVALAPNNGECWLALGWACYRTGDWKGAREAEDRAMSLRQGGDCRDWFLLAMIEYQRAEKEKARQWYDKAARWMSDNQAKNTPAKNDDLRRFRTEAAELLGIQEQR
jgi:tetratricopeptide (TPR) repeat protein